MLFVGQITALEFLDERYLCVGNYASLIRAYAAIGTGPYLKIYDFEAGRLILTRRVFHHQRVHGIRFGSIN